MKDSSYVSTANLADACLQAKIEPRCIALKPLINGSHISGRVVAVRHVGSVDVFLEAIGEAPRGCVLVIDDGGRTDRACFGDLAGIEAQAAGFAGIIIWGTHRDSRELRELGVPVFSLGRLPLGPMRLDARVAAAFGEAQVGDFLVTDADYATADDDGAIFFPAARYDEIVASACAIRDVEGEQARQARAGITLRDQFRFERYLERRKSAPEHTFRDHLRELDAEIER